jgi:hypothetical protein
MVGFQSDSPKSKIELPAQRIYFVVGTSSQGAFGPDGGSRPYVLQEVHEGAHVIVEVGLVQLRITSSEKPKQLLGIEAGPQNHCDDEKSR